LAAQKWAAGVLGVLLAGSTPTVAGEKPGAAKASEDGGAAVAPIELRVRLLGNVQPIVEGSVGGRSNVNILVDTGTTPAVIDAELARSLGLQMVPGSLTLLDGTRRTKGTWVPDLQVGPVHKRVVPAVVHDLSFLRKRFGVSVGIIIGFDVLGDTSFRLDYGKQTLSFQNADSGGMAIPVSRDWPFAVVNAEVDKQNLRLLVDTGAAGLVLFRERLHGRLYDANSLKPASVENLGGRMSAWGATPLRHVDLNVQGTALHADSVFLVADHGDLPEYDGLLSVRSSGFRVLAYDHETRTLYLHF